MGMFSEARAENEAEGLQPTILKAIKSNNEAVIVYCEEEILPRYLGAIQDSFSNKFEKSKKHKEIIQFFEYRKKKERLLAKCKKIPGSNMLHYDPKDL